MSLVDIKERKLYNEKYHIENKEKIRKQRKEHRILNNEKINKIQKDKYSNLTDKDKEKISEKRKLYYQKNKESIKKRCELYRKNNRVNYGKKQSGSYNIKIAERNKEKWLLEELNVYKFKIIDIDETIFYKFGLTNNINNRIRQIPYNVELISFVKISKYDAVYLESFLLKNKTKYIPLIKFSGYTECYLN